MSEEVVLTPESKASVDGKSRASIGRKKFKMAGCVHSFVDIAFPGIAFSINSEIRIEQCVIRGSDRYDGEAVVERLSHEISLGDDLAGNLAGTKSARPYYGCSCEFDGAGINR